MKERQTGGDSSEGRGTNCEKRTLLEVRKVWVFLCTASAYYNAPLSTYEHTTVLQNWKTSRWSKNKCTKSHITAESARESLQKKMFHFSRANSIVQFTRERRKFGDTCDTTNYLSVKPPHFKTEDSQRESTSNVQIFKKIYALKTKRDLKVSTVYLQ